jgi:hypothetical protein
MYSCHNSGPTCLSIALRVPESPKCNDDAHLDLDCRAADRALQTYTHEFHADRDHAMCNIQNRSIPAVQLTQL